MFAPPKSKPKKTSQPKPRAKPEFESNLKFIRSFDFPQSVFFAIDSAAIDREEGAKIDRIIRVQKEGGVTSPNINVEGYTSEDEDPQLAKDRTGSVRERFDAAFPKGPTGSNFDNTRDAVGESVAPYWRRAEIFLPGHRPVKPSADEKEASNCSGTETAIIERAAATVAARLGTAKRKLESEDPSAMKAFELLFGPRDAITSSKLEPAQKAAGQSAPPSGTALELVRHNISAAAKLFGEIAAGSRPDLLRCSTSTKDETCLNAPAYVEPSGKTMLFCNVESRAVDPFDPKPSKSRDLSGNDLTTVMHESFHLDTSISGMSQSMIDYQYRGQRALLGLAKRSAWNPDAPSNAFENNDSYTTLVRALNGDIGVPDLPVDSDKQHEIKALDKHGAKLTEGMKVDFDNAMGTLETRAIRGFRLAQRVETAASKVRARLAAGKTGNPWRHADPSGLLIRDRFFSGPFAEQLELSKKPTLEDVKRLDAVRQRFLLMLSLLRRPHLVLLVADPGLEQVTWGLSASSGPATDLVVNESFFQIRDPGYQAKTLMAAILKVFPDTSPEMVRAMTIFLDITCELLPDAYCEPLRPGADNGRGGGGDPLATPTGGGSPDASSVPE